MLTLNFCEFLCTFVSSELLFKRCRFPVQNNATIYRAEEAKRKFERQRKNSKIIFICLWVYISRWMGGMLV
jgi:hypothetical protein